MAPQHIVDHRKPLAPQLAQVAPGGIDYVFSTTGTDSNLAAYAETLNPFGHIVAIDDFDSVPIGVLKGTGPMSIIATLGLCVALVPLGARILRDGPAPRWWAYPLALGVGVAAVLLGMAG